MVSEPLFSIYFEGETEADELLDEPHEVMTKEEKRKRMSTCFINGIIVAGRRGNK